MNFLIPQENCTEMAQRIEPTGPAEKNHERTSLTAGNSYNPAILPMTEFSGRSHEWKKLRQHSRLPEPQPSRAARLCLPLERTADPARETRQDRYSPPSARQKIQKTGGNSNHEPERSQTSAPIPEAMLMTLPGTAEAQKRFFLSSLRERSPQRSPRSLRKPPRLPLNPLRSRSPR